MNDDGRQAHWDKIYRSKCEDALNWFERRPALSVDLIRAADIGNEVALIDIGGRVSWLVVALLDDGFADVTALDLSFSALAAARARLGAPGAHVLWIVADIRRWQPPRKYELWYDRAVFHFLTQAEVRAAYAERVMQALHPGGQLIIAALALEGLERCSGLPVVRHDAASIGAVLGPAFRVIESRRHEHRTLAGTI